MSVKETKALTTIDRVAKKEMSQRQAAEILKITERQVRNKLKRYKTEEEKGLIHKSRGKPSKRQWQSDEKDLMCKLIKNEFQGFGPTLVAEKLALLHMIKVSKETVRKSMIEYGLWKVNAHKVKHRRWRERKESFGQMTQGDGSPHDWFEGRLPKCTLLVFIDDATSKLVWLQFVPSESTESVMDATKNYILAYGRPLSLYVDYGSVFSVNTNNLDREKITQFERCMQELNIDVIHARSPQAKGRVERANRTLQDRLVADMRLANICSIEAANAYVRDIYIPQHNAKFAVEPANKLDLHQPINGLNLNNIFCVKEERVLQNDFTIAFCKRIFQLNSQQQTIIRPKEKITISVHLDKSISLSIRKVALNFSELNRRPQKLIASKIPKIYAPLQRPSENSRRWVSGKIPIYGSMINPSGE